MNRAIVGLIDIPEYSLTPLTQLWGRRGIYSLTRRKNHMRDQQLSENEQWNSPGDITWGRLNIPFTSYVHQLVTYLVSYSPRSHSILPELL